MDDGPVECATKDGLVSSGLVEHDDDGGVIVT